MRERGLRFSWALGALGISHQGEEGEEGHTPQLKFPVTVTKMASTEGLVPITRSFLASYYDKYPFAPLSDEVSLLSSQIRSIVNDLLQVSPPSQG